MTAATHLQSGFIDLHSHTTASDGSLAPEELIALATQTSLAALAITDHDTFEGYERAVPVARAAGLDLVRGIELNSRLLLDGAGQKSVHVLVYFLAGEPSRAFYDWLDAQRTERRARNEKLIEVLRDRGIDITLAEVEARGRTLTARPHFASVLVDKGYATSVDDAFRKYLGQDAPTYVERESEPTEKVIAFARECGGLPVVAHPVRIGLEPAMEPGLFAQWKQAGLVGLEVFHSEHTPALQAHYRKLAETLDLLPSGGSDFHGSPKPDIVLGKGRGNNVRVPLEFLAGLRQAALTLSPAR